MEASTSRRPAPTLATVPGFAAIADEAVTAAALAFAGRADPARVERIAREALTELAGRPARVVDYLPDLVFGRVHQELRAA